MVSEDDIVCGDATLVLATKYIHQGAQSVKAGFVDLKDQEFWKTYAWMLCDVAQLRHLSNWQDISGSIPDDDCLTCSPHSPSIKWRFDKLGQLLMYEDHIEAAVFERQLKARSPPFRIQLQHTNITTIGIAISIASLAHQASSHLPVRPTSLAWNLSVDYRDPGELKFPKFVLQSNVDDQKAGQPKGMKHNLREDQLRSLAWMAAQENGLGFNLHEVQEALLPQLNWKVEVKASAEVTVRGGVLADQPSYGKTVTTLALIHDEFSRAKDHSPIRELDTELSTNRPFLKATLIITPHHLYSQWRQEIRKFLPSAEYQDDAVLVIKSPADLKLKTIADLRRAKIVIVSWRVFDSADYVAQLAAVSALPPPPSVKGRQFKSWLQHAIPRMEGNLSHLQGGVKDFSVLLKTMMQDLRESEKLQTSLPPSSRKAAGSKTSSKAKAAQSDAKVQSSKRGGDYWEALTFPVFHMFRWNRIVVDEFSYLLLEDKTKIYSSYSAIYESVISLKAQKRWVLSGTPPLKHFKDVKLIAKFLDVSIGIDDYDPRLISKKNLSDIRKELSPAERFRSYQDRRSVCWHEKRHHLAQQFLDAFVRQNDAEVDQIQCYPALHPVTLGPSHRAIYEELGQYLTALDMQSRKASDLGSSRESEINDSLEASSCPEEAFLYRTSVFDLDLQSTIDRRRSQMSELVSDLSQAIQKAEALKVAIGSQEQHYRRWKTEDLKDAESAEVLQQLIKKAEKNVKSGKAKFSKSAVTQLRDQVLSLRPLARELASRIRSFRYVENIQKLSLATTGAGASPECELCCSSAIGSLRILSLCGHISCDTCLAQRLQDSCVAAGCGAQIDAMHIKSAADFGIDGEALAKADVRGGAKMFQIAELLQKGIPHDDQAVLFVPSYMLMDAVAQALDGYDIPFCCIEDNEKDIQGKIDIFQNNTSSDEDYAKVLILSMADEQASGL